MRQYRSSRLTIPLVLAALLAASAAPPAAPAADPATPPPNADFSTPVAATKTLLTALHAGDFTAARDALIIPADQKAPIDAFLDSMAATSRLQQAASTRFLSAGDNLFKPPTAADLAARLKRVAEGKLTIQDDTASLIITTDTATQPASLSPGPPPATQTLELKKVGTQWKVVGTSFFNLAAEPADTIARRTALARQLAAVADAVAKDITAGRFFSAADAYQEYWTRGLAAASAAATASAPAPTTKP